MRSRSSRWFPSDERPDRRAAADREGRRRPGSAPGSGRSCSPATGPAAPARPRRTSARSRSRTSPRSLVAILGPPSSPLASRHVLPAEPSGSSRRAVMFFPPNRQVLTSEPSCSYLRTVRFFPPYGALATRRPSIAQSTWLGHVRSAVAMDPLGWVVGLWWRPTVGRIVGVSSERCRLER